MRVISGTARGRKLKELAGQETRPTTDMVKEALFNIIQFELEGRRVLDLYAGTGQLAVEALSRGAASAVLVDHRTDAVKLIRENLALCGFQDRARVVQADAPSFLETVTEKFHIVFLDPPYDSGLLKISLERVTRFDILTEHGIIICESRREDVLPEAAAPYVKGREYRYGKIKLTLYRRQPDNAGEEE